MGTMQTEFTASELLADHDIAEPLIADGLRCHGGFDQQGHYVSPRTKYRWPAIHAWEEQRQAQFSTPILDVPLDTWPKNFPNVEQSKFLLRHDVPGPTIAALTRIGVVEGFGGLLRSLPIPEFSRCFDEEIAGTAIAHIGGGLSRPTPAMRPGSGTSPATTKCGSWPGTSPSNIRRPKTCKRG